MRPWHPFQSIQKNDLLTLIVEMYKNGSDQVLNVDALGEDLQSFYDAVDEVSDGRAPAKWTDAAATYHAAVISGSNERARRLRRATALSEVLAPHFAKVDHAPERTAADPAGGGDAP